MLRNKASKIEVKLEDKEDLEEAHQCAAASASTIPSIATALASSTTTAASYLFQHFDRSFLNPSSKAQCIGLSPTRMRRRPPCRLLELASRSYPLASLVGVMAEQKNSRSIAVNSTQSSPNATPTSRNFDLVTPSNNQIHTNWFHTSHIDLHVPKLSEKLKEKGPTAATIVSQSELNLAGLWTKIPQNGFNLMLLEWWWW